ncbi:MAG: Gfo/Idh/MocA family oxidoreductase [Tepidisphaeraceae bacterium]
MFNFAIVGCGNMAHWHAQELCKVPEVKVVALVDPVTARTAEFRQKYFPEAVEFASMESLLADGRAKLAAMVLVTPHALHWPHAKAALDRGLHVLTEKPMVTTSQHAYDLWRRVKATGKLLGITFQAPYTAEYGYLAELRDTGQMGKVQSIGGWVSQNWLKATANTWRQQPEMAGGGMMFDTGAHLFNAVMWLMNDPVVEVACFYDKCSSPVDISGVAIARFQNGAIASFNIGGNCPPFGTEIQIQTDRMLILTDQYGGKLEIKGPDGKRIYPHVKQDLQAPGRGPTPHKNFVNALLGKEPLKAGVRYGALLSALMDALYESSDGRRIVRVEPVPTDI